MNTLVLHFMSATQRVKYLLEKKTIKTFRYRPVSFSPARQGRRKSTGSSFSVGRGLCTEGLRCASIRNTSDLSARHVPSGVSRQLHQKGTVLLRLGLGTSVSHSRNLVNVLHTHTQTLARAHTHTHTYTRTHTHTYTHTYTHTHTHTRARAHTHTHTHAHIHTHIHTLVSM